MNPRICAAVMASTLLSVNTIANEIEEVIITSSLIDQTLSDIENPLHVVTGEDIETTATQSLGESLDGLLGVSSADYGSGVGQPIIRGMSGNRVKVCDQNVDKCFLVWFGKSKPNHGKTRYNHGLIPAGCLVN